MPKKCTPEECKHIAKKAYSSHKLLDEGHEMKKRGRIFQALGNETRLKILGMLSVKDLCACDIIEVLGNAASTTAYHLRMLENSGLIASRPMGKFILFRLNRGLLKKHRVFD